ncbi:hypothetical protein QP162_17110 [Sphingomonas aurantiaca]|uniref:hypothetical protein n=1 Tax=Sphingomonas aurantiaca TaxID=185949 RepID=UPI002FE17FFE
MRWSCDSWTDAVLSLASVPVVRATIPAALATWSRAICALAFRLASCRLVSAPIARSSASTWSLVRIRSG